MPLEGATGMHICIDGRKYICQFYFVTTKQCCLYQQFFSAHYFRCRLSFVSAIGYISHEEFYVHRVLSSCDLMHSDKDSGIDNINAEHSLSCHPPTTSLLVIYDCDGSFQTNLVQVILLLCWIVLSTKQIVDC